MNANIPSRSATAGGGDTAEAASTAAESDPPEPGSEPGTEPHLAGQDKGVLSVDCAPSVWAPVDVDWLHTHLARAIGLITRPVAHLNLRIVDDEQMRELHRRHRGSAETTDVLTFETLAAETAAEPIEADIAVCADVAERQAVLRGHSIERELLLYAVHGLLHCAGHDDHDDAAAEAMHAEEDRIMERIGVGRTYAKDDDETVCVTDKSTSQQFNKSTS
jgi:probable rRNA maturation factor